MERLATLVAVLLPLACATLPLDAPRGELVVTTEIDDVQLKIIELQHQDYSHAESISGFEQGSYELRQDVVAGQYCVERILYDLGAVGGGVTPQDLCFEVEPHGTTHMRIEGALDGRIQVRVDHPRPAKDQGPPIAGPD